MASHSERVIGNILAANTDEGGKEFAKSFAKLDLVNSGRGFPCVQPEVKLSPQQLAWQELEFGAVVGVPGSVTAGVPGMSPSMMLRKGRALIAFQGP